MSKVIVFILLFWAMAAISARAQSAVPVVAQEDSLERLEASDAYKQHLIDSARLAASSQAQIDSLFRDHDAITKTLKAESIKAFEAEKAGNEKTLKALRAEETELKKELAKEKKKTENWFNKQLKKSMKKTKSEDISEE